jgi:hypothetical protein
MDTGFVAVFACHVRKNMAGCQKIPHGGYTMKKVLLPLLAVCCLAPAAAFAGLQHPLQVESAETVAPQKFEAETAIEYNMFKVPGDVKVNVFTIQETVTGGIMPKLDAFVSVPFSSYKVDAPGQSRESGLNDVTIGARWGFAHVEHVELAVKPFISLPTGDENKNLGAGGTGFGALVAASMELSKELACDANVRFTHQGTKGDDFNEFGLGVAGKFAATKELKIVGEVAAAKTDVKDSKWTSNLTAGAVFAAQKNLDLDLGIRFGLASEDSEKDPITVLAGLTFKF